MTELKRPRVLVLGAMGYAGSYLAYYLRSFGYDVDGLDIEEGETIQADATTWRMDAKYDAVVNCAALVGVDTCAKDPNGALSANLHLPDHMARQANGAQFIHFSTSAVYGQQNAELIDETASLNPVNNYADTKASGDQAVIEHGGIVLRFSHMYGFSPCRRLPEIVNHFAFEAAHGRRIEVWQPQEWRAITTLSDMASAVDTVLQSDQTSGVWNVHSDNLRKSELADLMDRTWCEKHGPNTTATYKISDARFRETFEWHPYESSWANIAYVIDGIRQNPGRDRIQYR